MTAYHALTSVWDAGKALDDALAARKQANADWDAWFLEAPGTSMVDVAGDVCADADYAVADAKAALNSALLAAGLNPTRLYDWLSC